MAQDKSRNWTFEFSSPRHHEMMHVTFINLSRLLSLFPRYKVTFPPMEYLASSIFYFLIIERRVFVSNLLRIIA